jgi:hypothetical protein
MEYTITFTPESVTRFLNSKYDVNLTIEQVEEYWDTFEDFFQNFHYNLMSDFLWEDFDCYADGFGIPFFKKDFVESN